LIPSCGDLILVGITLIPCGINPPRYGIDLILRGISLLRFGIRSPQYCAAYTQN
jgi:hypothetical protein